MCCMDVRYMHPYAYCSIIINYLWFQPILTIVNKNTNLFFNYSSSKRNAISLMTVPNMERPSGRNKLSSTIAVLKRSDVQTLQSATHLDIARPLITHVPILSWLFVFSVLSTSLIHGAFFSYAQHNSDQPSQFVLGLGWRPRTHYCFLDSVSCKVISSTANQRVIGIKTFKIYSHSPLQ